MTKSWEFDPDHWYPCTKEHKSGLFCMCVGSGWLPVVPEPGETVQWRKAFQPLSGVTHHTPERDISLWIPLLVVTSQHSASYAGQVVQVSGYVFDYGDRHQAPVEFEGSRCIVRFPVNAKYLDATGPGEAHEQWRWIPSIESRRRG